MINSSEGGSITLAWTAPAIQTKDGLGRNKERKGACLE